MVAAIEEFLNISLRHARAQLGWSQHQLANAAGVHVATVAWAEKGNGVRLDTAYKMLNALNAERHKQYKRALALDDLTWNVKE